MISIIVAALLACAVALASTPMLVEYFRARAVGQVARDGTPATHAAKSGTPTMGGLVILVAATIGYAFAHVRPTRAGIDVRPLSSAAVLVLLGAWGQGAVGFVDDLLKVVRQNSDGLHQNAKMLATTAVAVVIGWGAVAWAGLEPAVTFAGNAVVAPPATAVFVMWVVVIVISTSHAVNLTDGTDGLAAGSTALAFSAMALFAFWEFRHPELYAPIGGSPLALLDVAVVSAALVGACAGFLWWNAAPAPIIMGDTGALALGGALAAVAVFTRTQLLLPVVGGLFVIEAISSQAQIIAIRRFGRRVFRRAPLHHHFEERGWQEVTVTTRFWLFAAVCTGLGIVLFYETALVLAR